MSDERELIRDYQETVRKVVSAIRSAYGQHDLLTARRSGHIPKEASIGDIEFSFHGVGCRGKAEGIEVDFEFGPGGRIDGFDAWRLWQFAKQRPKYTRFQREEDVEAALGMLERSGEIECPRSSPSPHLWYLK